MICGGSTFTNYFLCSQKSRAQLFVFNFQSYLNTIIEREISKKKYLQNWNRDLLISKDYCKWLYLKLDEVSKNKRIIYEISSILIEGFPLAQITGWATTA